MSETMELTIVNAQNAVEIFTKGGLDAVLAEVEAKVRAIPLDGSTAVGRDQIRSVAYKVTRTKTALDSEAKSLTEGWRDSTKKVNVERARAQERLDALAAEVRKPLTEFENKEKIRVAAHEDALRDITGLHRHLEASPDLSLEALGLYGNDLLMMHPRRNWEEFAQRAEAARKAAEDYLLARIEARKKSDAEQEELARFRKAEAERILRERDERLKAEAAQKATLEAERIAKQERDAEAKRVIEAATAEQWRVEAEAAKMRAEHGRIQRAAIEAREREESAKLAAEKRAKDAEAAKVAAEKKAVEDLKAAKEKARRDADAAVAKERERVEAASRAAEQARIKRESDEALRLKIRGEILDDLRKLVDQDNYLESITDSLLSGKVRRVKVIF